MCQKLTLKSFRCIAFSFEDIALQFVVHLRLTSYTPKEIVPKIGLKTQLVDFFLFSRK